MATRENPRGRSRALLMLWKPVSPPGVLVRPVLQAERGREARGPALHLPETQRPSLYQARRPNMWREPEGTSRGINDTCN